MKICMTIIEENVFFLNSNWKCNCMNECSFLFYLWNYSKFQKNYGSSCYKFTNKQICKFVKQFHCFNEKYQNISAIRPGICNCNIMKKYPGFMHFFINFMKIWQNDLVINTKDFLILTEWFCYFNERILSCWQNSFVNLMTDFFHTDRMILLF